MHDAEFPHEHEALYRRAAEIEGIEQITLTSVGVDIGSSTTHLLFSRLTLRRQGAGHSARFEVTERAVLWASPILLTPYLSPTLIDVGRIEAFIQDAYRTAGIAPAEIDTGAVVITGEALKKENAEPIIGHFAREAGRFICASAGPHHEALLAAHGSGAVALSAETGTRVLNVDMGGGTTKLSLIIGGAVRETAAINIGARLVAFDAAGTVTRLEPVGALVAAEAGLAVAPGARLDAAARERLGTLLADTLIGRLEGGAATPPLAHRLMITAPLEAYRGLADIDHLVFSGGVSEYLHNPAAAERGDLGPVLGRRLRDHAASWPPGMVVPPREGIRATVIGASAYTVQVSGATTFFTTIDRLPVFGQKVVAVRDQPGVAVADALAAAFRRFDLDGFGPGLVIALSVPGPLDYQALRRVAAPLAEAARRDPDALLLVVIEQDIAGAFGRILKHELQVPNDVVCIDAITVGDLAYIDVGRPMSIMDVFPVTVKSLLFSADVAR